MVNLFQKVPNLGIIAAIRVTNFDTVSKFGNFFWWQKTKMVKGTTLFACLRKMYELFYFDLSVLTLYFNEKIHFGQKYFDLDCYFNIFL